MRTSRKLFIWGAALTIAWLIPALANLPLLSFYNAADPGLVLTIFQVVSFVQTPLITFGSALVGAGFVVDYLERHPRDPIAEPLRILPERR